tara:strand:+ start:1094 stop:1681 length:588 start_codon:yes stop_codon:yes gene_type:complete
MGIVKAAADLTYAFRFVRMLVMKWENWDAYKEGLIDKEGKRIKGVDINTDERKNAYTPFIRLCANIKRLLSKIPGGGTKLGSFAAALFLLKENFNVADKKLEKILKEYDIDPTDFLKENTEWFILEDKQLTPGVYRTTNYKMLNRSFEEFVRPKDRIRVEPDTYPSGTVFGIDIYEAVHINTNQKIYVSASEIVK